MYETILVPVDGSNGAEAILLHVEELAKRYKARVVLVRVLEPIPYLIRPEQRPEMLWEDVVSEWQAETLSYMKARVMEFGEKGKRPRQRSLRAPL